MTGRHERTADPAAPRPRWRAVALALLPVLIILAVGGAAVGAVAALDGPPSATPAVHDPRPRRPLLDLRRDLTPLAEVIADRRLEAGLAAFVQTLPPDTCLSVDAGRVHWSHRGDDPQVPASTEKLATAVAALVTLGPEFRYRTVVGAAEPPVDGVVTGALYLVGGGDPLVATPDYAARFENQPQLFSDLTSLADAVVAAGVTRVDGGIVADETRYDQVRYHPAWPPRFITQDQTGPLSALAVNDGFAEYPAEGAVPVEPAADPAALAGDLFAGLLRERGVSVSGPIANAAAPAPLNEIAVLPSPPLRDVLGELLRESDNATAELVLKELGRTATGAGTFDNGAQAVRSALVEAGFDLDGADIVDGSGLAPGNALTCDLVLELLEYQPTAEIVADGLAVVGESGTLADRWLDTPLVGRVRAKTGTLNQVTALAGVTETHDEWPALFALIVNVPAPSRVRPETVDAQRRLAELLLAYPDPPDLSVFRPGAAP